MVESIKPTEAFEVLRKEPFGENIHGLVTVYHVTWRSNLCDIGTYGLQPNKFGNGFMRNAANAFSKERVADVNGVFDEAAKFAGQDVVRSQMVFARPLVDLSKKGFPITNVYLELLVDPQKCIAAEKDLYDDCLNSDSADERMDFALNYWRNSLSLSDYLNWSQNGHKVFTSPEILIPQSVPTDKIRIFR